MVSNGERRNGAALDVEAQMEIAYTGLKSFSIKASIHSLSISDLDRLVRDGITQILLRDGVRDEVRESLRNFLQVALEESKDV